MPNRFQKVFDAIPLTMPLDRKPVMGTTGYLDMMPWMPPTKGTDEYDRPFFTLPLHVYGEHRIGQGEVWKDDASIGQTTFFQRYTDSDIWVSAESHIAGSHANPCLHGELANPSNGDLEEMLLKVIEGEDVEFLWKGGWNDGTYYRRVCRLATVKEIREALKAAMQEAM